MDASRNKPDLSLTIGNGRLMFTINLIKVDDKDASKKIAVTPTRHQSLAAARAIALRRLQGCASGSLAKIFTDQSPPVLKILAIVDSEGKPKACFVRTTGVQDVVCDEDK